jgi:4-amino-4-deoxy-L-arabinose transferase-like glycosyltransferase
MKRSNFFLQMPRWYVITLLVFFAFYIFCWLATGQILVTESHAVAQMSAAQHVFSGSSGDSVTYVGLASSMLHGYFALPGEAYEYFRSPGYPGFIAAVEFFGGSYFVVTFLQILMAFATALMIRALGTKYLDARIGIVASLLFLLNPIVISLTLQIMSDLVFTFLLLLGVTIILFFVQKEKDAHTQISAVILAALVFAAATYVRPAGLVTLPLFIAPILVASLSVTRKFWYAVLLAGVFLLALLPWMIRNYDHSGVFSFSSLAAYNLTFYNVPMFEAATQHDSLLSEEAKIATTLGVPISEWGNLSESPTLEKYDKSILLKSPVQYAAYHLFESTGFFVNSGLGPFLSFMSVPFHYSLPPTSKLNLKDLLLQGKITLFVQTVISPWWLFVERIFLAIGGVLAIFGVFVKRREPFVWLAAFIILYFAALAGPVAEARYRLPAEPFLATLIASGLIALYSVYGPSFCQRVQKVLRHNVAPQ